MPHSKRTKNVQLFNHSKHTENVQPFTYHPKVEQFYWILFIPKSPKLSRLTSGGSRISCRGHGPRRGGVVCQNERIWTRGGSVRRAPPPLDPPMLTILTSQHEWAAHLTEVLKVLETSPLRLSEMCSILNILHTALFTFGWFLKVTLMVSGSETNFILTTSEMVSNSQFEFWSRLMIWN